MRRDFDFRLNARAHVYYRQGKTYVRVPEVQARAIVAAGAGEIVNRDDAERGLIR